MSTELEILLKEVEVFTSEWKRQSYCGIVAFCNTDDKKDIREALFKYNKEHCVNSYLGGLYNFCVKDILCFTKHFPDRRFSNNVYENSLWLMDNSVALRNYLKAKYKGAYCAITLNNPQTEVLNKLQKIINSASE